MTVNTIKIDVKAMTAATDPKNTPAKPADKMDKNRVRNETS
jgi:hypothetical protein